jgi:pathogen-inducible salicylic acid glucosyltransferase
VVPLARRHGAACAAFLTQTCAVDVVYTHARAGRVPVPMRDGDAALELVGLQVRLAAAEVPAFFAEAGADRTALRNMLMNQFAGLDKVDHVLVNSFYDLEPQVSITRSITHRFVAPGAGMASTAACRHCMQLTWSAG